MMRVLHSLDELRQATQNVYLAIGVFDGVHLGHQRVISQAREDARAGQGTSVVLTFDPHPIRILHPDKAPPLLTSTPHKLTLIETLSVDACLVLPFDKHFAQTPAESFIERLLHHANPLREICVGARFRFGHDRGGDFHLIEQMAARHSFIARQVSAVAVGDETISSTAVRQHVQHGRLDRAACMLGRSFSIWGTVEKGDQVGQQFGFPTANLNPHNEMLPPDGVYAAWARLRDKTHPAALNIGFRPTFPGRDRQRVVEVHLLDFHQDLYGQNLEVTFVKKLRDERKFSSPEALRSQISTDIQAALQLLNTR